MKGDNDIVFFSNVSVKIVTSAAAFQVSSVTVDLADKSPDECPYDYTYTVSITSTSAGKVTYKVTDSIGGSSGNKSLTFTGAGTKDADFTWENLTTGEYWVKVYIDTPNNQTFGPFDFEVNCP